MAFRRSDDRPVGAQEDLLRRPFRRDGGQLGSLCQHNIVVPSQVTARIQECHILIGHTLCGLIEQELGLA